MGLFHIILSLCHITFFPLLHSLPFKFLSEGTWPDNPTVSDRTLATTGRYLWNSQSSLWSVKYVGSFLNRGHFYLVFGLLCTECVAPKLMCCSSNPHCGYIWRWASKEIIMSSEGWNPDLIGLVSLRDTRELAPFLSKCARIEERLHEHTVFTIQEESSWKPIQTAPWLWTSSL